MNSYVKVSTCLWPFFSQTDLMSQGVCDSLYVCVYSVIIVCTAFCPWGQKEGSCRNSQISLQNAFPSIHQKCKSLQVSAERRVIALQRIKQPSTSREIHKQALARRCGVREDRSPVQSTKHHETQTCFGPTSLCLHMQ